jgi:hypothetical protein
MVDADGATKFSDLSKLVTKIKEIEAQNPDTLALVVGSRRVN